MSKLKKMPDYDDRTLAQQILDSGGIQFNIVLSPEALEILERVGLKKNDKGNPTRVCEAVLTALSWFEILCNERGSHKTLAQRREDNRNPYAMKTEEDYKPPIMQALNFIPLGGEALDRDAAGILGKRRG